MSKQLGARYIKDGDHYFAGFNKAGEPKWRKTQRGAVFYSSRDAAMPDLKAVTATGDHEHWPRIVREAC